MNTNDSILLDYFSLTASVTFHWVCQSGAINTTSILEILCNSSNSSRVCHFSSCVCHCASRLRLQGLVVALLALGLVQRPMVVLTLVLGLLIQGLLVLGLLQRPLVGLSLVLALVQGLVLSSHLHWSCRRRHLHLVDHLH